MVALRQFAQGATQASIYWVRMKIGEVKDGISKNEGLSFSIIRVLRLIQLSDPIS